MAHLLLPSRRLSQPQTAVGIDPSSPISRGLVGYINPAARDFQAIGAPSLVMTGVGAALAGNGSSMAFKNVPAFTDAATILFVGNWLSGSGNHVASIGTSTTGDQCFIFQSGATGASRPRALIRTAQGGSITTAETLGSGNDTSYPEIGVWVARYDGTTALKIYRNGEDFTGSNANTGASGSMASMNNIGLGGTNRGTDAFAGAGQLQTLGLYWNRALSPSEISEISRNPWQLFRPAQRRIYFDAGSGGGSVVGNASGALVSIGLDSATATASGSTVIPATGTASLAAVSLIASQSGASGVGSASSALDPVGITAANATASGGTSIPATGSGALVGISLASTQGLANGSALASAALDNISLTAAIGSASAGTSIPGNASASLASASISPASAQATAAATAAGPIVGMNLTPAQAQAASEAWASAQLAEIGLTAATGTANNLPNDFEPADQWRTLTIERSTRIMVVRRDDRTLIVQRQNRVAKA